MTKALFSKLSACFTALVPAVTLAVCGCNCALYWYDTLHCIDVLCVAVAVLRGSWGHRPPNSVTGPLTPRPPNLEQPDDYSRTEHSRTGDLGQFWNSKLDGIAEYLEQHLRWDMLSQIVLSPYYLCHWLYFM